MWGRMYFQGNQGKPTEKSNANQAEAKKRQDSLQMESLIAPETLPRILLIDDDPTFGMLMQRAAMSKGVAITFCSTVEEVAALSSLDFDVVIMDHDLGAVTGFELTTYLEQNMDPDVPFILVSQTQQVKSESWPRAISQFVDKKKGPFAILSATFDAHCTRLLRHSSRATVPVKTMG